MDIKVIDVGGVRIGPGAPLCVIAGPCVIEDGDHCRMLAERVRDAARQADVPLIFKASFDKANRSSADSFRGPGLKAGLDVLRSIGEELDLPTTTDIHDATQVKAAADVVDMLQIPAFLCRQTDLLQEAARSGRPVNIKKGQFMAPGDMRHPVAKVRAAGGEALLTERGTTFGYNNLVVDMRALPILRDIGVPVIFDGTHAVQMPGAAGDRSGGDRKQAPVLLRAAVAAGVDGVFIETHDDPENAKSDGPNMIPVNELADLLTRLKAIHAAAGHE
jgi:2-dehydro-3-deoxyphosphooctonate aldolase (KDO 8-P synthase)